MNLRGNSFSLGLSRIVSAVNTGGTCHIFLRRSGPIAYMQFNAAERTLKTVSGFVSNGDYCRLTQDGLVEYSDGNINYPAV